jgi:replicative DNA helicase
MTDGVIQFPGDSPGDPPVLRTLPHLIEAEKAFLGAVLVESGNTIMEATASFLRPEHFAYLQHGRIFEAAAKLIERGQIADAYSQKRTSTGDAPLPCLDRGNAPDHDIAACH